MERRFPKGREEPFLGSVSSIGFWLWNRLVIWRSFQMFLEISRQSRVRVIIQICFSNWSFMEISTGTVATSILAF